jgi:hypothetical protein
MGDRVVKKGKKSSLDVRPSGGVRRRGDQNSMSLKDNEVGNDHGKKYHSPLFQGRSTTKSKIYRGTHFVMGLIIFFSLLLVTLFFFVIGRDRRRQLPIYGAS